MLLGGKGKRRFCKTALTCRLCLCWSGFFHCVSPSCRQLVMLFPTCWWLRQSWLWRVWLYNSGMLSTRIFQTDSSKLRWEWDCKIILFWKLLKTYYFKSHYIIVFPKCHFIPYIHPYYWENNALCHLKFKYVRKCAEWLLTVPLFAKYFISKLMYHFKKIFILENLKHVEKKIMTNPYVPRLNRFQLLDYTFSTSTILFWSKSWTAYHFKWKYSLCIILGSQSTSWG